ncbi:MAG: NUDIX pyrophosphatase [bacterium]|nr:NUDIX pyrophosphatase [bacterium]
MSPDNVGADQCVCPMSVVTCFLESEGKILLLKRSSKVGTYQGKWAGVSGYLETAPEQQALKEINEETSLTSEDVELLKKGKPVTVKDNKLNKEWKIYPFMFRVKTPGKIKIDWEHSETMWIKPEDMEKYDTVPKLKETFRSISEV